MRTEVSNVRELPGMHLMGQTCANLNGELLFVWGGTYENGTGNYCLESRDRNLWIYDTLTGYWRHRICSGECPFYLSSCASWLIGRKMYLFGGHSTQHDNWLNSLYCLDLDTFVWRDLSSVVRAKPTKPIRSDKSVSWSYAGKLYLFGGYGWSQTEHYLELLDCQKDFQLAPDQRWPKFGWNNQLVEFNPEDNTWRWPNYSGTCPSARAAHSGALLGDKYYVFGGRDCQQRLNDLYTFDMRTFEWKLLLVMGDQSQSPATRHLRPIGHLLEPEIEEEDLQAGQGMQEDEQQFDDDEGRQQQREMIEEEEQWSPSPSSSSAAATQNSSGVATAATGKQQQEEGSRGEEEEAEDDYDYDCFEYPHPSHMLERWSLSSSQSSGNATTNATAGSRAPETMDSSNCQQMAQDGGDDEDDLNSPAPPATSQHRAGALLPNNNNNINPNRYIDQIQNNIHQTSNTPDEYDNSRHTGEDHDDWDEQDRGQQLSHQQDDRSQQQQPMLVVEQPQVAVNDNNNNDNVHADREESSDTTNQADNSTNQSLPTGRSFCSFTPITEEDILLFGGVSSQGQNLNDCWLFNVAHNRWTRIDLRNKKPRLWHTGSRTKFNEIVIIGGSSSDKIDEYCCEVMTIALEPKSLKRLALDAVSKTVRVRTLTATTGIPSTISKLIKLRKQALALSIRKHSNNNQRVPMVVVVPSEPPPPNLR